MSASTAAVRDKHVGPPGALVGGEHGRRAGIGAGPGEDVAEGGDVAIAEIEALRADRREEVRRLADQHDAIGGECGRGHARERERLPRAVDADRAEQRARARLDLGGERRLVEGDDAARDLRRPVDPDQARSVGRAAAPA